MRQLPQYDVADAYGVGVVIIMPTTFGDSKIEQSVNQKTKGKPTEYVAPKDAVPVDEEHIRQLLSFALRGTANEKLKNDVINYVLIQFNDDSLQGNLDYYTYKQVFEKAQDGLFCIVYFQHYKDDLVDRDVVFAATFDLLTMLYSRVLGGKHYNLLLAREQAKQQVILQR